MNTGLIVSGMGGVAVLAAIVIHRLCKAAGKTDRISHWLLLAGLLMVPAGLLLGILI